MINHHVSKYTCQEILPSVLMNRQAMITTGQLPKFQDDIYSCIIQRKVQLGVKIM